MKGCSSAFTGALPAHYKMLLASLTGRLPFVPGLALPVWPQQPLNAALELGHSLCQLQCQLPT